jgi:hypothetical protein
MDTDQTTYRSITFARPFILPGMDKPHRPGTFELRETRESFYVMHGAYKITSRLVLVSGNTTEVFEVTADELEFALALDETSVCDGGT